MQGVSVIDCQMSLEGLSRLDRVRNVDIRSRLGQERVADMVLRQQQEQKQRVVEMSDGRVTKMVYDGSLKLPSHFLIPDVSGKRPRRKRWRNNFN